MLCEESFKYNADGIEDLTVYNFALFLSDPVKIESEKVIGERGKV